ncbi:MAG: diacylglycerol kinase family protein [Phaeodactylibacter sp.]|nr:diacylglycerol kinase family protein [Phaeodactylibacter sp.]MCB9301508.1 diacylglycerol kinase family protein [Lewinellaceae bacterium]HQU60355.1 diacylglycerol kinase family protein [Saprospiraceae bacterium]
MLRRRLLSFQYAFTGIATLMRSTPNAWIHLLAALAAITLGFFFSISTIEWCLVALAIAFVFAAEAFNTALEHLTDLASPGHHPLAGKAKDLAAGAVLLAALGAAAVGLLIFGPKVLAWWN